MQGQEVRQVEVINALILALGGSLAPSRVNIDPLLLMQLLILLCRSMSPFGGSSLFRLSAMDRGLGSSPLDHIRRILLISSVVGVGGLKAGLCGGGVRQTAILVIVVDIVICSLFFMIIIVLAAMNATAVGNDLVLRGGVGLD